ncbi:hypothetical protein EJ08DRAFT_676160 [Tothia fuscella]|uniref:Late endosomal/lysosomal adaptor and MAPK and MTOR activator 1 n=1 Tax=Tothia fuscella TaxID=1048955 RepID=A0A9P4NZP9_9PEZI|nr:hypothetical protein EJ08DRAFT_676160 [Tothia fuscella]
MGICASCLGIAQHDSQSDPSDTQHLLGDPYPTNQYGSLNVDQRNGPQVDPEEIKKQRDALERLCAQTTDKLIDVTQVSNNTDESSTKIISDYSKLFVQRFNTSEVPAKPESTPQEGGEARQTESRPSTGSTAADEDDTHWLRLLAEDQNLSEVLDWKAQDDFMVDIDYDTPG